MPRYEAVEPDAEGQPFSVGCNTDFGDWVEICTSDDRDAAEHLAAALNGEARDEDVIRFRSHHTGEIVSGLIYDRSKDDGLTVDLIAVGGPHGIENIAPGDVIITGPERPAQLTVDQADLLRRASNGLVEVSAVTASIVGALMTLDLVTLIRCDGQEAIAATLHGHNLAARIAGEQTVDTATDTSQAARARLSTGPLYPCGVRMFGYDGRERSS
jgi:hypothetical protein